MGEGYIIYKVGVCKIFFFKEEERGLNFVVLW